MSSHLHSVHGWNSYKPNVVIERDKEDHIAKKQSPKSTGGRISCKGSTRRKLETSTKLFIRVLRRLVEETTALEMLDAAVSSHGGLGSGRLEKLGKFMQV